MMAYLSELFLNADDSSAFLRIRHPLKNVVHSPFMSYNLMRACSQKPETISQIVVGTLFLSALEIPNQSVAASV